ncbi:MAG: heme A synthase [Bryobacteraceae bacterium]|nr:heme A synthase [Bryobacteraceae bacterium]
MYNRWLHFYCVVLAVCTLFLVVAGASVTSNDAGLSVPDWPLSYGKLMPDEMKGGIFYEHGHRMVATTVGFLTIILAVWMWKTEERGWMRKLGWIALGAVIVQGVLGGMTVLFLLPKPVSISHACLAQLFFTLTVCFALFTSAGWKRGPEVVEDTGSPPLRSLAVLAALTVFAQLALGAAYRHGALGLVPHVVGAIIVAGVVLIVAMFALQQFPQHRPMRRAALAMLLITMVQVLAGIAAYMSRIYTSDSIQPLPVMVAFTVLHVALGAVTLASSVVFAIQVVRNARPPLAERISAVSVAS